MQLLLIVSLVVLLCVQNGGAQQLWASPCPRLFSYEPQKENDRWYGVVTLISETDLKGVWLRVAFDRPSIQLGNWFGEIRTSDNTEYLIHNRNHELKANMPYALRFYLKYNPSEPPPQLTGIRLNARPVCPEGQTTTPAAITGGNALITSAPDGQQPLGGIGHAATTPIPQITTQAQVARPSETFARPGGGWPGAATPDDDDDDVFQGDFQLINRPHLRPQAEPECGTVVMAHERRKRRAGAESGAYHQHHGGHNFQHTEHTNEYHQFHNNRNNYHGNDNNYRNMRRSEGAHGGGNGDNGRHYGRTPNFPQVEYFYVDVINMAPVQAVPFSTWSLREWVWHVLNQSWHSSTTTTQSTITTPELTTAKAASVGTGTIDTVGTTTVKSEVTPVTTAKSTNKPATPYVGGVSVDVRYNHTADEQLTHIPLNPDHELMFNSILHSRRDDGDEIAPLEQQPRPLITYGQSTKEGEFPWHAALYHERGADLQYICGASLISRSHVITVAHCVTRRRSASTLNPDSLVVYLGKYYLKKWGNPGIQDSQVSTILPHPEYNSQTYANDIAILKLVNPVGFTDYVRPICLWGDGDGLDGALSKPGTVVGWGFDHTGKVTEQLTQAKMPVVTKETCIYSFPDFFSRFTTSKTYCAGFRNGTSVCNGDSGGGMVFPKATSTPGREVWQLRGLVSISVALQNQFKCDSSHYVVFTDVAKYLDWIHTALRQQ